MSRPSVLFLCTENASRSQMAEVLLRHQAGDLFDVYSAGTQPADEVDPRAIRAIEFFGAEVGQPKPKSIESFAGRTFDFVITLCDKSLQSCQNLAQAKEQLHWNIPDPRAQSGDEGFDKALTELNERIKFFVLVNRR
ncbi:arsenate reductase ArsC [Nitrincola tapanii]|uniref:Arsenate reductase ArsC n=1 Tax=Nitrincola tapanii TaxID=1708751 RepID=A0A5A9W3U6_9GAMM|nr:arsenate reductase ArsC [Nitrincola tapanii]KAA0875377.1 arsenate reductase ArsC [Nitrincola tapanii]